MNLINTPEELLPEKLWSIEIGSYLTKHNTGFFKAKIARTPFLNSSEKGALKLLHIQPPPSFLRCSFIASIRKAKSSQTWQPLT
jgi:hypothetical protein